MPAAHRDGKQSEAASHRSKQRSAYDVEFIGKGRRLAAIEKPSPAFEFTWEGNDEMDPVSGSGWLRLKDKNTVEGRIKIHLGDGSLFLAKRAGSGKQTAHSA